MSDGRSSHSQNWSPGQVPGRYRNIQARVDTGIVKKLMTKAKGKIEMRRRDEQFDRIKLSVFVKMIIEFEQNLEIPEFHEDEGSQHEKAEETPVTSFQSFFTGIGEKDRAESSAQAQAQPCDTTIQLPYLLLDVRSKEEFRMCHIITAKNYPSSMVLRDNAYETPDLALYKNHKTYVIIVYDVDERQAPNVASTLVRRGFENLYLLTGGLRLAYLKFPSNLITGDISSALSLQSLSPLSAPVDLPVLQEEFVLEDLEKLQIALDALLGVPAALNQSQRRQERLEQNVTHQKSSQRWR